MALKPSTIKKLREIQDKIKLHPLQFWMAGYFSSGNATELKKEEHCGTAACIAGWAISIELMKKKKLDFATICEDGENEVGCVLDLSNEVLNTHNKYVNESELAAKLLGITQEQTTRLFLSDRWPVQYREEYWHNDHGNLTYQQRVKNARLAVARIEHFIKTGGAE